MREKRRGFTLIELLAVIVILAIIALIATPIVLKLIETSRKGAFARSAEGVLKASKLYYTSSLVENVDIEEITFKCNNIECISSEKLIKLDIDGNMGTGDVTITSDGKVSFELGNGTYCAEKKQDSDNIKVSKKVCGELVINKPSDLKITYKTDKAGEITVIGSVSNDNEEIKLYEFSIDNGTTWVKAEGKTYTFTGLEMGKEYKVLMRVTNLKDEQEQIELESITTSLLDNPTIEVEPSGTVWATSKTVTITGPEIDENIYKVVYSLDGINYQDYIGPIEFTENGAIKVDIVKKEDNTSILKNKVITKNVIMIDATVPTVSLDGLTDTIMEGESYELPTSYTVNNDLSGGNVKCTDEGGNEITNTSILIKGEHTITCIVTTGAGNTAEASKTITIKGKDRLENRTYTTGEAVSLGGYNWHVIGDTGAQVTLLMDANQLGNNSEMNHCTADTDESTDCGVYEYVSSRKTNYHVLYSWDKSLIRTYLNNTLLLKLQLNIANSIVEVPICSDPSRTDGAATYGGYLISELEAMGKTSECTSKVSDKVRLITRAEYYNMSPYYTTENSIYPNTENITKISSDSNYTTWLSCRSDLCGDKNHGYWWTMNSFTRKYMSTDATYAYLIGSNEAIESLNYVYSDYRLAVRPVITLIK